MSPIVKYIYPMKITEVAGKWLSAHLWKTDFTAVGRTEVDARCAYAGALNEVM